MKKSMTKRAGEVANIISSPSKKQTYHAKPTDRQNPHSYSDDRESATGKVYRKIASSLLRKKFTRMSPKKRKNLVWFTTFQELEKMIHAEESILYTVEVLGEACTRMYGPRYIFDFERFTEYILHGGPEDRSIGMSKLRHAIKGATTTHQAVILIDAVMVIYEEMAETCFGKSNISWQRIPFSDFNDILEVVLPIACELGIKVSVSETKEIYNQMLSIASEAVQPRRFAMN